jgi:hypothetical protein
MSGPERAADAPGLTDFRLRFLLSGCLRRGLLRGRLGGATSRTRAFGHAALVVIGASKPFLMISAQLAVGNADVEVWLAAFGLASPSQSAPPPDPADGRPPHGSAIDATGAGLRCG